MEEEWRSIANYEGVYEVSNTGRVRRGGKELFGTLSEGYRNVTLCVKGEPKTIGLHRLVATAFLDNPDKLPLVRHLNDVRDDNRVENLAWGTQSDNMFDAVRNGRNHEALKTSCIKGHDFDKVERGQRVCITCRDESRRKSLARARATMLDSDSPIHGTRNGYNTYSCRCIECRQANAKHQRRMKNQKKEKTYDDQSK